jgi:hypothetical protein
MSNNYDSEKSNDYDRSVYSIWEYTSGYNDSNPSSNNNHSNHNPSSKCMQVPALDVTSVSKLVNSSALK